MFFVEGKFTKIHFRTPKEMSPEKQWLPRSITNESFQDERNNSKRIVSRMTLIVSSLHLVCRKKDSLSWKKKGGRRKSKLLAKYMSSFENFHSCFLLSLNTFPTFSDAGKFSMITSHNKSWKWIETRASKLSKYLNLNFRHGEARRCAATSMAMWTSWLWGQVDRGGSSWLGMTSWLRGPDFKQGRQPDRGSYVCCIYGGNINGDISQ